jgi:predicted phosphodiesterase
MRLQIMSDLHLEHHRDYGRSFIESLKPDPDVVLILAGDITSLKIRDFAKEHLEGFADKYRKVFYVPGNHEFYGTDPQTGWFNALSFQFEIPNFTVLSSDHPIEFEGKRFLGDTLWFPWDRTNDSRERMLSDFSQIRQFKPWVYDQNDNIQRNFERHMQKGDVVITHHMPHVGSVHAQYKGDDLNRFFLCDMEPMILAKEPALWVHGHTHEAFDYTVASTRIVCNPLGYPRERKYTTFNDNLIVEV